jgi:endonuclease/exonuclease/phosphatase family metal-dependent hydrolase
MRRGMVAAATASLLALAATTVVATPTGARGGPEPDDLRVVSFNVLHGAICPDDSDGCQLPDRMELLGQRLETAACPQVVGLQEVSRRVYNAVRKLPAIDECDYEVVLPRPKSLDRELVLTSLDAGPTKVVKLVGGFRTASRVELESPVGPVVVVVTHQDGDFAPGEPGADATCTEQVCPPPCEPGSPFLGCQTTVSADLAERSGGRRAIRILMGDFNVTPSAARIQGLVSEGWVDTHLAAGNTECDPTTGAGCTSGRRDDVVDDMKDPASLQSQRIDFMLLRAPAECRITLDPDADADGDGLGTGIWDDAVIDGPGGMAFVSDHSATSLDLACEDA